MLEVYSLFSGSKGNSLLIRSGSAAILMDAGRSRRAISSALAACGTLTSALSAVFITHEHTDHTAALPQLALHDGIPVHAAADTAAYLARDERIAPVLVPHPSLYTVKIGTVEISSFPLPHDSLYHVGYLFRDEDGDAFCAATDMGHVTDAVRNALLGCRGALLEANHDPAMLRSGPYPAALKARILSPRGHLSNEECGKLAAYAAMNGVTRIALGHLSDENNTPETALRTVSRALCGQCEDTLCVCARDTLTRIL